GMRSIKIGRVPLLRTEPVQHGYAANVGDKEPVPRCCNRCVRQSALCAERKQRRWRGSEVHSPQLFLAGHVDCLRPRVISGGLIPKRFAGILFKQCLVLAVVQKDFALGEKEEAVIGYCNRRPAGLLELRDLSVGWTREP